MDTFNQILELDEDEDTHDFSQPMVWEYFEQAEKTFNDMDIALKKRNLDGLSSLGHFLKGSSAALGLSRVQDSCEKIQHLGHLQDGEHEIKEDEALAKIMKMIKRVRSQYSEAKSWLIDFFGEEVA
ncbi:signal transduction histidine kinase [Pholiota molesta]|nr:signal transduction histidine kinase [Pholiota molesta]